MPDTRRFHTHLLRRGRFSETGRIYLLTSVTHTREPVFTDFTSARLLIDELRLVQQNGWASSLAWVVMPDHLHWLVQLNDRMLADVMKRVKSNSSRRINRCLGRTGALWQDGFHDRAVRQDEDVVAMARYIVANPVRAGLVRRVGDYPFWDAAWL
ncbi:REP-associated tyrosine transposase [Stutzerimonas stutzeri]